MKIVFWGSSDFSMPSLEKIAAEHEITAVVTNEDAACGRGMKEIRMTPVKKFALEKKLPVLQPCSLKEESFPEELKKAGGELFAVVSYGKILPASILEMPRYGSINLHGSLLPVYRGASPIQAALVNGDAETGVSVQYMSREMDKGDVLNSRTEKILPDDNYAALSGRLALVGADILLETIRNIGEGKAQAVPQDEGRATYTRRIRKEDGKISFIDNTARDIYNKWRGYCSWPGVFTGFRNSEIPPVPGETENLVYLTEMTLADSAPGEQAGRIIGSDRAGLTVGCRQGSICIRRIKPSGKKEMDMASFLNGYRPVKGRYF